MNNPAKSESPRAATPGDPEPTLTKEFGDSIMTQAECKRCTVPLPPGEELCPFCISYTPPESPAQRLDVAVNRVDLLRHDINDILRELSSDAPLFAVADVVTSLGHLRRAAVALDRANDTLEADAKAVQR